jgi:Tfp pilus assembly protein PilN
MRPVNLIPADQRRGAARPGGQAGGPTRSYILLGVLGAALLCVLALVITSNKISSKTDELAKVSAEQQSVKQQADALRPYGQFADLQQARQSEIDGLISSRFDWETALSQLSRAIPRNAWLLSLAATLSPAVEVEGGTGGGDTATLRKKADSPAFTITGCTYSHHAVARMMVRMQNLDDVTDVELAKSARRDDSQQTGATAPQSTSASAGQQESQDCVGSQRITKFDILIVFGGSAASGTGTDAGVPSGAAAPLAQAQAAGDQAQASSSAAQSQAVSATGGSK